MLNAAGLQIRQDGSASDPLPDNFVFQGID